MTIREREIKAARYLHRVNPRKYKLEYKRKVLILFEYKLLEIGFIRERRWIKVKEWWDSSEIWDYIKDNNK